MELLTAVLFAFLNTAPLLSLNDAADGARVTAACEACNYAAGENGSGGTFTCVPYENGYLICNTVGMPGGPGEICDHIFPCGPVIIEEDPLAALPTDALVAYDSTGRPVSAYPACAVAAVAESE